MSEFELHKYTKMAYDAKQIISFSQSPSTALPNIDEEMKFHTGVSSVEVCNLTQKEFDYFISNYGDNYESIYFFHNTKVKDLTALSKLKKVKYLLFYNVRGTALWDMSKNEGLRGIMISESKKCCMTLNNCNMHPILRNCSCSVIPLASTQ
jgi:hypothetical protein